MPSIINLSILSGNIAARVAPTVEAYEKPNPKNQRKYLETRGHSYPSISAIRPLQGHQQHLSCL